jgi:ankyrin repeat protein
LNAAKDGNADLVEILIDNKAFIECRDMGGFTPLMWACYKNKLSCAKLLIENGANVNAQCKVNFINILFKILIILILITNDINFI